MPARALTYLALRRAIVSTARRMNDLGINQGTSGNIGMRVAGGLLVTPTGIPYEKMRAADIVEIDRKGKPKSSTRRPTSEWRIHADILAARPDTMAVIHTHSSFATALACLGKQIPAFHYMVAVAGGDSIRCAAYATFGTAELARHVLQALEGRRACLMANHGMVALGSDLDGALRLAVEVETLAEQYWRALQVGKPKLLPRAEMARVLEKFKSYGQQATFQKPVQ